MLQEYVEIKLLHIVFPAIHIPSIHSCIQK